MKNQANQKFHSSYIYFLLAIVFLVSCNSGSNWYKGNMHTHTFWSDGDDFPENVAKWYKDNGYNFLVFTDHNIVLEGEKWKKLPEKHPAIIRFTDNFGEAQLEKKSAGEEKGFLRVRIKALDEFRSSFEDDNYLLIMGNEISSPIGVHITTFHQEKALVVSKGSENEKSLMIGEAVSKVDEYRKQSGRNTHATLAHPNFKWAITAEMILENPDLRFFEI